MFYSFLRAFIGEKYCCNTSSCEYVFNNGNSQQKNCLLTCIDEPTDVDKFKEQIKSTVTLDIKQVKSMGKDPIQCTNYTNLLFCTNNDVMITSETGQRRNYSITINKYTINGAFEFDIKNRESTSDFFNPLWDIINNKNLLKMLYDYFMHRKMCKDYLPNYINNHNEATIIKDPFDSFLDDFIGSNVYEHMGGNTYTKYNFINISSNNLYKLYNKFCINGGFTPYTITGFGLVVKRYLCDNFTDNANMFICKKRSSSGFNYIFNLKHAIKTFNISIDMDNNEILEQNERKI